MISFAIRRCFLALSLFAMGSGVCVAQSKSVPVKSVEAGKTAEKKAATAKDSAKSTAGSDAKKLVDQLNARRDSMITDHEALAKQLKDATEEQRKAILEKMQQQKKAFEEAQSALHKQIRDENRRQRQNAAPGRR